MEKVNIYILLELPFDPPENNEAKIEEAIEKKRQQWSKDANNPFKKDSARYLGMLEDIKKVMRDPVARRQEAEKAQLLKKEKSKTLDSKLSLYASKGNELSPRDLKILLKDFGLYGYDENAILSRFAELSSGQHEAIVEIIDRDVAKNIKKCLSDLGIPDDSLYDFLGVQQNASSQALVSAADELRKKLLAKGEQTGSDAIKQQLSALCKSVFQSEKEKEKYDNYLRITKYSRFNKMIDEAAQMNKRVIEPKIKESLLSFALKEYGGELELSQASIYLENYCEYMGYTLTGGSIICGACGTENPAGSTVCSKCHRQLIIVCPRCGARNDNVTKSCIKCGFDLQKIETVKKFIEQAKAAVTSKDYSRAIELLEKAKIDWPDHPDIAPIEKLIDQFRKGFDQALSDITKAVDSHNYYAARSLVEKAQNDGYEINAAIRAKIDSTIRTTEEKLKQLSSMDDDQSFEMLASLSMSISDSVDLRQMMRRYPPAEPSNLKLDVRGDKVYIEWEKSSSKGTIEYVLVRKENTYSNSAEDGVIYVGKECSYTDESVPKSKVLFYSIYARRVGICSNACRANNPIVIVEPLNVSKCIGGDNRVDITWTGSPTVSSVKLWKYKGVDQPSADDFVEEVPCNRLDGIVVNDLENGKKYWFKLAALHNINGKAYASRPVIVNAVPLKPAKPVEGFAVEYKDGRFFAKWEPSEWDVVIFCSEEKPSYASGTLYDLREIGDKLQKIDATLTGDNTAEFRFDFVGQRYIVPAIINATNVVLSDPIYISNIPNVSNVFYDFNQGATELYVEFDWPKGVDNAVALLRLDAYPEDPNDPIAIKSESNKKQYDANAGIVVHNPPAGMLYASIYSFIKDGNERVYSQPERILINNEPQRSVLYSFKYKKPGLFAKASVLTVDISSNGVFVLPQFVIVAKNNGVPLRRDDGDIICGVSEQTEINGTKRFELEVPELRKGTKLKMFFLNDKHYKKYKIQNSGSNVV